MPFSGNGLECFSPCSPSRWLQPSIRTPSAADLPSRNRSSLASTHAQWYLESRHRPFYTASGRILTRVELGPAEHKSVNAIWHVGLGPGDDRLLRSRTHLRLPNPDVPAAQPSPEGSSQVMNTNCPAAPMARAACRKRGQPGVASISVRGLTSTKRLVPARLPFHARGLPPGSRYCMLSIMNPAASLTPIPAAVRTSRSPSRPRRRSWPLRSRRDSACGPG